MFTLRYKVAAHQVCGGGGAEWLGGATHWNDQPDSHPLYSL